MRNSFYNDLAPERHILILVQHFQLNSHISAISGVRGCVWEQTSFCPFPVSLQTNWAQALAPCLCSQTPDTLVAPGLCSSSTEHFIIKIKLINVGDRVIIGMCHRLWDYLPPVLHSPLHLCYIRNTQHPSPWLNSPSWAPVLPHMLLTAGKRLQEQVAFDWCSSHCLGLCHKGMVPMIMKAVKKPMGNITVIPEVEIGLLISKLQFTASIILWDQQA